MLHLREPLCAMRLYACPPPKPVRSRSSIDCEDNPNVKQPALKRGPLGAPAFLDLNNHTKTPDSTCESPTSAHPKEAVAASDFGQSDHREQIKAQARPGYIGYESVIANDFSSALPQQAGNRVGVPPWLRTRTWIGEAAHPW
jgi:hypothetical protein